MQKLPAPKCKNPIAKRCKETATTTYLPNHSKNLTRTSREPQGAPQGQELQASTCKKDERKQQPPHTSITAITAPICSSDIGRTGGGRGGVGESATGDELPVVAAAGIAHGEVPHRNCLPKAIRGSKFAQISLIWSAIGCNSELVSEREGWRGEIQRCGDAGRTNSTTDGACSCCCVRVFRAGEGTSTGKGVRVAGLGARLWGTGGGMCSHGGVGVGPMGAMAWGDQSDPLSCFPCCVILSHVGCRRLRIGPIPETDSVHKPDFIFWRCTDTS